MKKSILVLAALGLTIGLTALNATVASEKANDDVKSVGWFVANIKDARLQNQQCHDTPSQQSSQNCANALHALEISFKGAN